MQFIKNVLTFFFSTYTPLTRLTVLALIFFTAYFLLSWFYGVRVRAPRLEKGLACDSLPTKFNRLTQFLLGEDRQSIFPQRLVDKAAPLRFFQWRYLHSALLLSFLGFFAYGYTWTYLAFGFLLLTVSVGRAAPKLKARQALIKRMFDVAVGNLDIQKADREAHLHPASWVALKSWADAVTPSKVVVSFPTSFPAQDYKRRQVFEEHFAGVVSDENDWNFKWEPAKNFVVCERVPLLPTMLKYEGSEHRKWSEIPLGVATTGEVLWDVTSVPHMLLTGTTGSGKSVLQRNIIFHCIQHADKWTFFGIDLKRVELSLFKRYSKAVTGIGLTLEEGYEIVKAADQEMMRRYEEMEGIGKNNYLDMPNPPKAIMIMVDEAFMLLSLEGGKDDEAKERDALKAQTFSHLGNIARLGRAAGVHLVVATQRPDATVIKGEFKQNLAFRVAAGRADSTASQMTLDSEQATKLPPIKGRGYFQINGAGAPFQGYFTKSESWIDGWLEKKGLKPDGTPLGNSGSTPSIHEEYAEASLNAFGSPVEDTEDDDSNILGYEDCWVTPGDTETLKEADAKTLSELTEDTPQESAPQAPQEAVEATEQQQDTTAPQQPSGSPVERPVTTVEPPVMTAADLSAFDSAADDEEDSEAPSFAIPMPASSSPQEAATGDEEDDFSFPVQTVPTAPQEAAQHPQQRAIPLPPLPSPEERPVATTEADTADDSVAGEEEWLTEGDAYDRTAVSWG